MLHVKHILGREGLVLAMTGLAVLLGAATAHAQDGEFNAPWSRRGRAFRGPQTHVGAALGLLALPTTKVCVVSPGSCTRGDTTVTGSLTLLYQPSKALAFGSMVTMSSPFGSDTPSHSSSSIPRSHRRQYLLIDLVARDYAFRVRSTKLWLGGSAGGVVIYDFYRSDTKTPNAPILGPTAITLRTEGLSTGLGAGASWAMYDHWSAEASLRMSWWFLPSDRTCAPTGDCASLAEDVAMFWVGFGVAYHSRL